MTIDTKKKLRLLVVGTYPPPFGGIATHLTKLIPGLKRRGAEDIAVLSFSDKNVVETRSDFTLYRFNVKDHLKRMARPAAWPLAFRTAASLSLHRLSPKLQATEIVKAILVDEVARKHDSNVVSFYQSDMSMELPGLARSWGGRRGIVLTVFGEIYETASGRLIRDHPRFFRRMLELPDALAASSRYCSQSFAQLGVTRPIEPVYYGVDLAPIPPTAGESFRAKHGIGPQDVVVLFMSRFSKEMGLDVVLKAVPQVVQRHPGIKIILAGATGDQSEATATVAAAHPKHVLVVQDVPFSEQGAMYGAADMLVAPSFNQRACMGMAIKEAMAAALPVIGGAGGGVSEAVVDGETGFLVPVDSTGTVQVDAFAKRVAQLIDDPALRKRLGAAGRRRAEELFAYETTNDRMTRIFQSAMR